MEDLPLGRIAALVPEFAVKDLPLGRILMMIYIVIIIDWDDNKNNCMFPLIFRMPVKSSIKIGDMRV